MKLGKYKINIEVDNKQANQELEETNQELESMQTNMEDVSETGDALTGGLVSQLNNVKKGIFNLGSGKSYSINSVVKIIQKITKDKKTIKTRNVNRRNDVIETKADVRKLFLLLGWKPKWSLEKGIAKVLKK